MVWDCFGRVPWVSECFPMIFGHIKVVSEKILKLRNLPWKRVFSFWSWIWVVKTRFRVAKLEFFRIQCESYDQTLAARGSQWHYLNFLGTDFSYHSYFLKKIIFWTFMSSKSQNYKHCTRNFNVILRFWGHGGPKNNFFQKIKTIWKIRPERI